MQDRHEDRDHFAETVMLGPALQTSWGFENVHDKFALFQTQTLLHLIWFQFIRRHLFKGWLSSTIIFFLLFVLVDGLWKGWTSEEFHSDLKYASIPVVSILFTWWHVWLGLQMCFYPVQFKVY